MAHLIQEHSFHLAWRELLNRIMYSGIKVVSRDSPTLEILNATIEVTQGRANILVNSERDVNYRFMIAEWLWIQGGLDDVESLAQYNSVMRKFSDDGQILSGAYGPRLSSQWKYIKENLQKEASRQAVSTIWTPNPKDSKDIPCTISLHWMIRYETLHCTINMRSSDIWLGLPYDFFTFSQLTNYLSGELGVRMGSITMNLASSHLYLKDLQVAKKAKDVVGESVMSPQLSWDDTGLSKGMIRGILDSSKLHEHFEEPWSNYELALSKNKSHALEVLRELETRQKRLLSGDAEPGI